MTTPPKGHLAPNRGLLQAAKQALAALDRLTPGWETLYEARAYLRAAIKREEAAPVDPADTSTQGVEPHALKATPVEDQKAANLIDKAGGYCDYADRCAYPHCLEVGSCHRAVAERTPYAGESESIGRDGGTKEASHTHDCKQYANSLGKCAACGRAIGVTARPETFPPTESREDGQ